MLLRNLHSTQGDKQWSDNKYVILFNLQLNAMKKSKKDKTDQEDKNGAKDMDVSKDICF